MEVEILLVVCNNKPA